MKKDVTIEQLIKTKSLQQIVRELSKGNFVQDRRRVKRGPQPCPLVSDCPITITNLLDFCVHLVMHHKRNGTEKII